MLGAERNNELLVRLLLAGLVQDAHVRLATVEGLGRLAETAGKAVVDERELKDALERLEDGHLALSGGGIGGNLDLLLGGDDGLVVFSVRLCGRLVGAAGGVVLQLRKERAYHDDG